VSARGARKPCGVDSCARGHLLIVGALRQLGMDVARSTVKTYRVRRHKPPLPTWKACLNHVRDLVAMDCLVVPTVTFKVLFVLVILAHER